jgi:hypothetical protein
LDKGDFKIVILKSSPALKCFEDNHRGAAAAGATTVPGGNSVYFAVLFSRCAPFVPNHETTPPVRPAPN